MSQGSRVAVAAMGMLFGAALAVVPPAHAEDQGFTPVPVIKGVKSLETGSAAPDFTVKDVDGKTFTFAEVRDKRAHLLVFWSIFCEPCREEMPVIQKIADESKTGGSIDVITVNMDGEPFLDAIKGFLKSNRYTLRVVLDELNAKGEQFAIADPYHVAGTPVLYLVDAGGKVAGSHLGRIAEADLRAMIGSMLGAK